MNIFIPILLMIALISIPGYLIYKKAKLAENVISLSPEYIKGASSKKLIELLEDGNLEIHCAHGIVTELLKRLVGKDANRQP